MPSSSTFHRAYHRFAVFLAACVFLLIIAGALVTSNKAGLAVPDWPTSFGSFYRIPPMVGGVKYEHGHRMFAEFVGLLTIIFAVWTQQIETRRWMKWMGWIALGMVIIQGVLGGLTVLHRLPWYISTMHAIVAQSFFALTALFVLWTSSGWTQSLPAQLPVFGSVRKLSIATLVCIYAQLFFGAGFRHAQRLPDANGEMRYSGLHFWPHLVGAVVTFCMVLFTGWRVTKLYKDVKPLRLAGASMKHLAYLQVVLGIIAYYTRLAGRTAPQPGAAMVTSTVLHVAVGALLIAAVWIVVVQTHHQLIAPTGQKATSA